MRAEQVVLAEGDSPPKREAVYATVDPPKERTPLSIFLSVCVFVFGLFLIFALPFVEDQIRHEWGYPFWGYAPVEDLWGLPRLYGLVIIFNLILPSLFTQLYLAFTVVTIGRKRHGYKLPVMYAAVDMHIEDVVQGGAVLSGGDASLAQRSLEKAVAYSCYQRAHQNALETFPMFLSLSAAGGARYPIATAIHGACWLLGRIVWTRGYLSATPIKRYDNPLSNLIWFSFFGVMATSTGLAIGLLGGPV